MIANERSWVGRRSGAGLVTPWLGSVLLHGAIVIGGMFVVWQIAPGDAPEHEPVVVSFEDPSPSAVPIARAVSTETPSSEAQEVREMLDASSPTLPSLDEVLESVHSSAPEGAASPVVSALDMPVVPGDGHVTFAGLGASNAKNVVYVVDASGSMIGTLPLVRSELIRSVRRLSQTQRFQVIFFQVRPGGRGWVSAPHPMDAPGTTRPIPAFPAFVAKVCGWIEGVRPGGGSNPIPALEAAIGLGPDAIFVLSSALTGFGDWEPDREVILEKLDRLNPRDPRTGRRRVVIKTIQFVDEDPTGILRAIGEAHGGLDGHRFIGRDEMMRSR